MASLELLECAGCGLLKIRQDLAQPYELRSRYVEAAFLWRVKPTQHERQLTDPHDPVFLNTTLPTRCFSTPPYQCGAGELVDRHAEQPASRNKSPDRQLTLTPLLQ